MITQAEAYAMDQASKVSDCINGSVMLLRDLASRLPSNLDDVAKSLESICKRMLSEKERMLQDREHLVGSHTRVMEIFRAELDGLSCNETWKCGRPTNFDGKPFSV